MSVKFGMFPQADLSASFFAGVGMSVFLVKANGIRGYGTVLELLERSRKGV